MKQFFTDGTFEYSPIQRIRFDLDIEAFSVFPNPTQDELFVNLKSYAGSPATLVIYNNLGQAMQRLDINEVLEGPVRLELNDYKPGVYAISVNVEGKQQQTVMFIVGRL